MYLNQDIMFKWVVAMAIFAMFIYQIFNNEKVDEKIVEKNLNPIT